MQQFHVWNWRHMLRSDVKIDYRTWNLVTIVKQIALTVRLQSRTRFRAESSTCLMSWDASYALPQLKMQLIPYTLSNMFHIICLLLVCRLKNKPNPKQEINTDILFPGLTWGSLHVWIGWWTQPKHSDPSRSGRSTLPSRWWLRYHGCSRLGW